MEVAMPQTNEKRFFLKKQDRLFSKIQIEYLFKHAKHFTEFPIRFSYCVIMNENRFWFDKDNKENQAMLCMFTASKRNFKRANKRNQCKRLMREAYRLNRTELLSSIEGKNIKVFISLNYIGKEILSFIEVETALKKLMQKCMANINRE
jgi:ribonuclease P protein component